MFAEDLAQFFDSETGFAVTAIFKRGAAQLATVPIILTTTTQTVGLYDTDVEEPNPTLLAQTTLITAVRRGDTVTAEGLDFRVENIAHDGTGKTTISLAKI